MATKNLIFTKSNIISISSVITSTFDNYCYLGISTTLLIVLLTYVTISRVHLGPERDEKDMELTHVAIRFIGSTFK